MVVGVFLGSEVHHRLGHFPSCIIFKKPINPITVPDWFFLPTGLLFNTQPQSVDSMIPSVDYRSVSHRSIPADENSNPRCHRGVSNFIYRFQYSIRPFYTRTLGFLPTYLLVEPGDF